MALSFVQTAGVIIVAYACMDLRELALPGGFLLLLLSAAAQLPFFIFLCNYLDGDVTVGMKVRPGPVCTGDCAQASTACHAC